jgi:ppGpp synthetase/RelA/SpoT-type nucleotidyltranferase
MAWVLPEHNKSTINRAGEILSKADLSTLMSDNVPAEYTRALSIVNNWRASHAYPLNTFQVTLRGRSKKFGSAIVAQRIKRFESIRAKLLRFTVKLAQMQDIGGCRVILNKMADANSLRAKYREVSEGKKKFMHKLVSEKDYILYPKSDGYRGYHLIFSYVGEGKYDCYTGLKIEIQIRTQLQHAWATAVESVGLFTKQALKSNQGSQDWLRFFSLVGSAMASMEKTPLIPGTPIDGLELYNELRDLEQRLKAREILQAYRVALNKTNEKTYGKMKYHLLKLDLDRRMMTITSFKDNESKEANTNYTEMERVNSDNNQIQIVLVATDSLSSLKKAYPNYFLDTERFISFFDAYFRDSGRTVMRRRQLVAKNLNKLQEDLLD